MVAWVQYTLNPFCLILWIIKLDITEKSVSSVVDTMRHKQCMQGPCMAL